MQWYSGPEGDQRIWYEADEIEQMAVEQLRKAELLPSLTDPVADLELLVEGYLRCDLDLYADLPSDVLGLTIFDPKRKPRVQINSELTCARDEEGAGTAAIGRWRATIAHEASHVYLHRYLYEPEFARLAGAAQPLTEAGARVECLHRDISPEPVDAVLTRRRSDWREVQANRGMAALLMPRRLFNRVALREMGRLGLGTAVAVDSAEHQTLTSVLASTFEVSLQAAGIRLKTASFVTAA
ncbi:MULTISPECIES: ImmA/IrrE family metallo-endopeptidase [unclassified Mycobacterium]|uniref:ImmA/IrrE family metallo-endopeptidase n=1 Tax=unclassified Mycobacterium TaxID=2642494 RepID=UPI003876157D